MSFAQEITAVRDRARAACASASGLHPRGNSRPRTSLAGVPTRAAHAPDLACRSVVDGNDTTVRSRDSVSGTAAPNGVQAVL
jgi:hypothetical protein